MENHINRLILNTSRLFRLMSYDVYVPQICNSVYYKIYKNEICNCYGKCKFPPSSGKSIKQYTKTHLNESELFNTRGNGASQLYS